MRAAAHAISLRGLEGIPVLVEAHVGGGLVSTTIVGLPDAALRESKERLRAALSSCHVPPLNRRLTVNLSPASLPKSGAGFDLAIALAVLMARELIAPQVADGTVFAAEVGLDGSLRPVDSALTLMWAAKKLGFKRIVVAPESLADARNLRGIEVVSCASLKHLLDAFHPPGASHGEPTAQLVGGWPHLRMLCPGPPTDSAGSTRDDFPGLDLVEVRGQPGARRALLVAAAGGHHMLLHGDPGSGKTLLAERFSSVLPALTEEEAVLVGAIHSAAGQAREAAHWREPPNLDVSPTTTLTALLGGGSAAVRPGLVSLAHKGVLVVNEAPIFSPRILDYLRQPLETGAVAIRRAEVTRRFPAQFQLVLTANPCPCGAAAQSGACKCTPTQKMRHQQKLSGPLLDRIDIHHQMLQPHLVDLEGDRPLSSGQARDRVTEARARSRRRWAQHGWQVNAKVPGRFLREQGGTPTTVTQLLNRGIDQGWLSLRGADRILRLAWSVADLAGHASPTYDDFSLAMDLRTKNLWSNP